MSRQGHDHLCVLIADGKSALHGNGVRLSESNGVPMVDEETRRLPALENSSEIGVSRTPAAGLLHKRWKLLIWVAVFAILAVCMFFIFPPSRPLEKNPDAVLGDYPGWLECTGTDWERLGSGNFVPQYNRTIKTAVITLAADLQDLSLQDEILMRLPSYSKVYVLLDKGSLSAVRAWVRNKKYRKKLHFVTYEDTRGGDIEYYSLIKPATALVLHKPGEVGFANQYGSPWAQDLFDVTLTKDGEPVILKPVAYSQLHRVKGRAVPDNLFLDQLEQADINVETFPMAFHGGNTLFDVFNGRKIVFLGSENLLDTQVILEKLYGISPSIPAIKALARKAYNADEVIAVKEDRAQLPIMYHIDLAMVPVLPGVACITRLTGPKPSEREAFELCEEMDSYINAIRVSLETAGYRLIEIETSYMNTFSYHHSINTLPFVNADTGQRCVYFPVFADSDKPGNREAVSRNVAAYESIGYKVIKIPDTGNAAKLAGGIHCLINVLE